MTRRARSESRGFTLVEIVVVLGVIAALISILAPRAFVYIHEANQLRAQADANALAAAIDKMYKDTGRWPFYLDGDASLEYTSGTDAAILTSNRDCDMTSAAALCDDTVPEDATAGDSWDVATSRADSLVHHLIMNTPGYRTTGRHAWRGPYVDKVSETDPWDRSYLVNIANADPAAEGSTQRWVVVISAGPNGRLESGADAQGTTNPEPTGDDILARVK